MLADDELQALADDIAANGLQQPVVVDADGGVLDGRNRLAACQRAGVEPSFVRYEGDPIVYVLGANVHRRHLSTGQRAMATAVVLAQNGHRNDGRWRRGSVPADNRDSSVSAGWEQAMRQAGAVLDEVPELAPAVVADERSLDSAYQAATERRRAKTEAAQKVAEAFGRAVHLLATFVDAPVGDFVASYGPPALPVDIEVLAAARAGLARITEEWPR